MKSSAAPALFLSMRDRLVQALPGVLVTSGLVSPSEQEHLMLLEVPQGGQEWRTIGNRSREETGTVLARIWVVRPGSDEAAITAARERAYELLAAFEELLVADPTWGGTVLTSRLSGHDLAQAIVGQGRACELDFETTYQARLTR
jgi:hypothetical protein